MSNSLQCDYKNWGVTGTLEIINEPITEKAIQSAINSAKDLFALNTLFLKKACFVNSYQSESYEEKKLILLRFEKADQKNIVLDDEHISLLFDEKNNTIFGYMNLINNPLNNDFIDHQTALNQAINFLRKNHIMSAQNELPVLVVKNKTEPGSKMVFNNFSLSNNFELHWIGRHTETITVKGKIIEISGMKVKLYNCLNNLWTWVIIDAQGNVIALECNIFWNFSKGKRETQLWLHDKWLVEQKIAY